MAGFADRRARGAVRGVGRDRARTPPGSRWWSPPTPTVPGPGTSLETRTGAGAVAFVLSGAGGPARLRRARLRSMPDHRPLSRRPRARQPRPLRRPPVPRGGVPARRRPRWRASWPTDVEAWSLPDPDGRLGAALAKRLGGEHASAELFARAGETGAAAPLLGLLSALTKAGRLRARSPTAAAAPSGSRSSRTPRCPGPTPSAGLLDDGPRRPVHDRASHARASWSRPASPSRWASRRAARSSFAAADELLSLQGRALRRLRHDRHAARHPPVLPELRRRKARGRPPRPRRRRPHLLRELRDAAAVHRAAADRDPRPRRRLAADAPGHRRRGGPPDRGARRARPAPPRGRAGRAGLRFQGPPQRREPRRGWQLEPRRHRRRRDDQVRRAVRPELRGDGGRRVPRRRRERGQGLRRRRHRHRVRGHPARDAVGSGGDRRQHGPQRDRDRGRPHHPHRERVPVAARTPSASARWPWPAACTTSPSSSASRRCATRRPRSRCWPAPRRATRSTAAARLRPRCSPRSPPGTCTSSARRRSSSPPSR